MMESSVGINGLTRFIEIVFSSMKPSPKMNQTKNEPTKNEPTKNEPDQK
jgi:hypothetical protein